VPRRRLTLPVLALLTVLAAAILPSGAAASKKSVNVGIANQNANMFGAPAWQALKMKRTRHVVKWNAIDDERQIRELDDFVDTARRNNVDVLLHISTDDFRVGKGKLPSTREYKSKVGKLVSRYYAKGVREWGVWNEANDRTQPTQRAPRRAAEYFMEMWRLLARSNRCGKTVTGKCRIIALDLLDGRSNSLRGQTRSYIRSFYKRLNNTYDRRARFIGLHNYSDTNRKGRGGTTNVIRELRRHNKNYRLWLTETGGIVKLGTTGDFKCDPNSPSSVKRAEDKAASSISWMFRLALDYRKQIDRVYIYKWTGTSCIDEVRFDSGLQRLDGSLRPAYSRIESKLRRSSILRP
jgi:hypothetical protein